MAESSRSDPNRSSSRGENGKRVHRKSSGKSQPVKQEKTDRSDRLSIFSPIRSLRSLLSSWKKGPSEDDPGNKSAPSPPPKAKSTDNIFHEMRKEERPRPPAAAAAATAAPVCPSTRPSRNSMGKQLSISADNLVSSNRRPSSTAPIGPGHHLTAAHATGPAAISDRSGSEASTLDTSTDELNSGSTNELVDEFFVDRWSQVQISGSRSRAYSSGDADEAVDLNRGYDLDVIHRTKGLDVSACKDRILIKPKGKKPTLAMQDKVKKAELDPKPVVTRGPLHSLAEVDEDESSKDNSGRRQRMEEAFDTACPQLPDREATPPPEAPPRRKRSQAGSISERNCYRQTIGIAITPAMLTGALKKPSDREGVTQRPRPTDSSPPLEGLKKRKQQELITGNSVEAKEGGQTDEATTGDTVAEWTGGSSVVKRQVHSCSEEEERNNNKGARPKEPPKIRPKTRPKTMLHPVPASSTQSPSDSAPEPEWMARAKKKRALLE